MELIALLPRYYAAGQTQKAAGPMLRLAKVMAAVAEDSAKAWTRNKMAGMSGMSNSTLTRFFNRFVGCSPVEYLLRVRIKKACALLSFPDLTISEIASSCGFSDSNYFCRQFRRRMKCSPLERRKFIMKTRE
jgi:AraC-like DNA-binding protein